MDAVSEEIGRLYEGICVELTDISGDENDVVGVCTPYLTDGVKAGMLFAWKQGATQNSGAMTLVLSDGGSPAEETAAIDIVDLSGAALVSGRVGANTHQVVYYSAEEAKFILLTDTRDTNRVLNIQEFTANGTWTKPAGTPGDALVIVDLWGAGGGGGANANGGGGGGGSFRRQIFKASDLSSTVSVTVPAGGAVNTAGGNSTFGSLLTAYGGAAGANAAGGGGGGGGGRMGAGSAGSSGTGGGGGRGGGGGGGAASNASSGGSAGTDGDPGSAGSAANTAGAGGDAIEGGAGGGGGNTNAAAGGNSVYGGAGGGGGGSGSAGGTSVHGGNGGASGVAGSAPGGGGGRNAAGGRGFCRVRTIS